MFENMANIDFEHRFFGERLTKCVCCNTIGTEKFTISRAERDDCNMKKTYVTTLPDHVSAFLQASKCLKELGVNITRLS